MKFPSYLRIGKSFLLSIAFLGVLASCKKDDPKPENEGEGYSVPSTYDFKNVSYTGQTQRLDMLDEMMAYIKSGNDGEQLDLQKILNMYSNEGNPFEGAGLNESGKQLRDKTFASAAEDILDYMHKVAEASQSTEAGKNGTAGVVTSKDGSKKYLLDENGFEHIQLIEKGLMGALLYYQSTSVYLSNDKIGNHVDNSNVVEGKGTTMEHHWDEAFGYFGVPKDFPANKEGLRYWGKYCNARDGQLNSNSTIMNAFIAGRAAISNKDMEVKDQNIAVIREEWEKVCAATAISYLEGAKKNFGDDALRNHQLSEAYAFIYSLKFNEKRKISTNEIDQVLGYLGTNFYEISTEQIDQAISFISGKYGI